MAKSPVGRRGKNTGRQPSILTAIRKPIQTSSAASSIKNVWGRSVPRTEPKLRLVESNRTKLSRSLYLWKERFDLQAFVGCSPSLNVLLTQISSGRMLLFGPNTEPNSGRIPPTNVERGPRGFESRVESLHQLGRALDVSERAVTVLRSPSSVVEESGVWLFRCDAHVGGRPWRRRRGNCCARTVCEWSAAFAAECELVGRRTSLPLQKKRYCTMKPPSTPTRKPVTWEARLEPSHATASPISSGLPKRFGAGV